MPESYRKPWYRRWWGILIILILAGFLVIIIAFGFYVFDLAQKIQRGEITSQTFSDNFKTPPATGVNLIANENRPFIGPADAPVVIVGFLDFECPYCQKSYQVIKNLSSNPQYQGKVKFVFRHFPLLGDHENALLAAQAAECAGAQGKFWEMTDFLFASPVNLAEVKIKLQAIKLGLNSLEFGQCLNADATLAVIENDLRAGLDLGVEATPVFFLNGQRVEGELNPAVLEQVVELLMN